MQLAMREWRQLGKWRGPISAIAIGAVLGVMGPFGSQSAYPTAVKYVFWMAAALAGYGAAAAAERVIPSGSPGGKTAARIVAVAAASAVPMTFFVAWAMGVVRPSRTFSPVQLLGLYPYVALVQLLIAWAVSPDKRTTGPPPWNSRPPLLNTRLSSCRSFRLPCAGTYSRLKPRIITCACTLSTARHWS